MSDFFSHPTWLWIGFLMFALIVELFTGSFFLLFLSFAIAITAIATALFEPPGWIQFVIFSMFAILSSVLWQRYYAIKSKETVDNGINTNALRLIGLPAKVIMAFEFGVGRVLVEGVEWSAKLEDTTIDAPIGAFLEVKGIDNIQLIVGHKSP